MGGNEPLLRGIKILGGGHDQIFGLWEAITPVGKTLKGIVTTPLHFRRPVLPSYE